MNQQHSFDAAQVARAAAQLLGQPVDAGPLRIAEGLANENWRVESAGRAWLCKIGPDGEGTRAKWRAAARGRALAQAAGVPVPVARAVDEHCALLRGRPLRIFEFVEGESPISLAPASAARFWRALGTVVRQLHTVALPAFSSRLDGSAPGFLTWHSYLAHRLPQVSDRVARSGCFDAKQLDRLWQQVLRAAAGVGLAIAPRLVHRDLHAGNLLATPAGEVACMLDFDLAEAWDPAAEFFKLRHFAFADDVTREVAFMAGYGDAERELPGFETRVLVASCVEFVNMAANDALGADAAGVAWSHARLDALLRQAGWPRLEHRRD